MKQPKTGRSMALAAPVQIDSGIDSRVVQSEGETRKGIKLLQALQTITRQADHVLTTVEAARR